MRELMKMAFGWGNPAPEAEQAKQGIGSASGAGPDTAFTVKKRPTPHFSPYNYKALWVDCLTCIRRAHVNRLVRRETGLLVQSGPFAGMRLTDKFFGDGNFTPQLLGTYEQELHPILMRLSAKQYTAIVNIGCGHGYYAVGMALLFPECPVYAFDINKDALRVAAENCRLNGVASQICLGLCCDAEYLNAIAQRNQSILVISDCEGYEFELFSTATYLKMSDLIIECHDFNVQNCTDILKYRFCKTHTTTIVHAGWRNPNTFRFLAHLSDTERWSAICENRYCAMHWLFCEHNYEL